MQDVHTILPVGTIVQDRYVIEDLLGRGGFGAVYLVKDLRVRGNLFALKEIIDNNKQERERFAFECDVLKRLDHRSLPRVYRAFEDDVHGRAYMLMDYIEGANLEKLRARQPDKRFSASRALDLMEPIFDVVTYFHQQQPPIIHRDIKPANIIVPIVGDEAVLVDFGIAKEYNMDATTTAIRRCSPGYGAPEQYDKGTDSRTDIYGLAATLYALLTGTVPIDAFYRMTQVGGKHSDPLEPVAHLVPDVPQFLSDAIQKAMAINSADRFASVEEFWLALNEHPGDLSLPLPIVTVAPIASHRLYQEPSVVHERQEERSAPVSRAVFPVSDASTMRDRVITQTQVQRKRGILLLMAAVFLIVFALIGGVVVGSGYFAGTSRSQLTPVAASKKTASVVKATATHTVATRTAATATSVPTRIPVNLPPPATTPPTTTPPTATPPPQATTSPTQVSGGLPTLAASYIGTVTDEITTPSTVGALALSVNQSGATISGYATISGALTGSGNYTGKVTASNTVWFLVNSYGGFAPLYFSGQIAGNSMSGTYCSYVNNACDHNAGGYGTWQVAS